MRTLIAYATKSGACRECADVLAEGSDDSTVCDLRESMPDIAGYDMILIGTGIRFGKAYKPFRAFLEKNASALLTKRLAFFICNKFVNDLQGVAEKNIPIELRNAAIRISAFGGKPPFGKAKEGWMLTDEVDRFIRAVKAYDANGS